MTFIPKYNNPAIESSFNIKNEDKSFASIIFRNKIKNKEKI